MMRLRPGDLAPDFDLADMNGGRVSLRLMRGHKILLCFYRYAGCPFCNLAFRERIRSARDLAEAGLRTVAFFQSDREHVMKFPMRQNPLFPVIADPDRVTFSAYGIEASVKGMARTIGHLGTFVEAHRAGFRQPAVDGDFFLMPAEFLVDEDGRVRVAHYWRHLADPLRMAEILKFLGR